MSGKHPRAHHSYLTRHQLLQLLEALKLRLQRYEFDPVIQFLERVAHGARHLQILILHTEIGPALESLWI